MDSNTSILLCCNRRLFSSDGIVHGLRTERIAYHPNRCRLPISPDTGVGRASNGSWISNRRGTGTVRCSAYYVCPVDYHELLGSLTQRDFPASL